MTYRLGIISFWTAVVFLQVFTKPLFARDRIEMLPLVLDAVVEDFHYRRPEGADADSQAGMHESAEVANLPAQITFRPYLNDRQPAGKRWVTPVATFKYRNTKQAEVVELSAVPEEQLLIYLNYIRGERVLLRLEDGAWVAAKHDGLHLRFGTKGTVYSVPLTFDEIVEKAPGETRIVSTTIRLRLAEIQDSVLPLPEQVGFLGQSLDYSNLYVHPPGLKPIPVAVLGYFTIPTPFGKVMTAFQRGMREGELAVALMPEAEYMNTANRTAKIYHVPASLLRTYSREQAAELGAAKADSPAAIAEALSVFETFDVELPAGEAGSSLNHRYTALMQGLNSQGGFPAGSVALGAGCTLSVLQAN